VSEETLGAGSPAETEKAQGIDRTGGGKTHSNGSRVHRRAERNRERKIERK